MYEIRVDGDRKYRDKNLALTRELFWLLVDDYPGCLVELVGPSGVIDFV